MTREDARYYLQSSGFSEEQIATIERAFKQDVLDKIRVEIKDRPTRMLSSSNEYERGVNAMVHQSLVVIDKYKGGD